MGISGLLPLLKEIQVHGNIKEFRGKRLAVDAYVWLHKGAFGCAEELVKGKKTTRFVDYAMHRVRLLRHHGITPYIVFDGGPLPAKKGTEVSRAKSRADNLARAMALESQGRWKEARDCYTKCVDITPEMAYQLIKALRAENVDYVVAPYEADAQLCYLEREGYVDGIITEDSDLLVFGCRRVIFKLDGNGDCVWIHRDKLATIRDFPMHGWTDVDFRRMAMLSGCDYLDSVPGIGLKTAHRLLRRYKTVDKLLKMVKLEGQLVVPADYAINFAQAELAFIHQRVFCPQLQALRPLNDLPEAGLSVRDQRWVGLDFTVEIARGVATGELHPETRMPIEDQWPEYQPGGNGSRTKTILGDSSKPNIRPGTLDAFVQRSKVAKVKPLPEPVGTSTISGVARLSDMATSSAEAGPSRLRDDPPAPSTASRSSKFFSRKGKTADTAPPVELKWESSSDTGNDVDEPVGPPVRQPRSPSIGILLRSPSPVISSLRLDSQHSPSPNHQVTSPAGTQVSSPAVSSPTHTQAVTSPRRRSARSGSPVSPTRPSRPGEVLVSESSQVLGETVILETLYADAETETPQHLQRPASRLDTISVLVPASSPCESSRLDVPRLAGTSMLCHAASSDSIDTIDDEEVVTPSYEPVLKRKAKVASGGKGRRKGLDSLDATILGKRKSEDDLVQEQAEERRSEKAKVVAQGWRTKFAFKENHFASQRTDKSKKDITISPHPRSKTPLPLSATTPRILNARPVNIPIPSQSPLVGKDQAEVQTSRKAKMASSSPVYHSVSSPRAASPPGADAGAVDGDLLQEKRRAEVKLGGLSWSRLERYKFTGKVDVSQGSSPLY